MLLPLSLLLASAPASALPCTPAEPAAVIALARSAIEDAEPARATRLVEQAIEGLPCSGEAVTQTGLATLFQVGGFAAGLVGEPDREAEWYVMAAVVAPAAAFDPSLGAEAAARYDEVTRTTLLAAGTLVMSERARVDGVAVPRGTTLQLPPGRHLVQTVVDGAWVGSWVVLTDRGRSAVGVARSKGSQPAGSLTEDVRTIARRRRARTGWTIAGTSLLAVGGAGLVAGFAEREALRRDVGEGEWTVDEAWEATSGRRTTVDALYATGAGLGVLGVLGLSFSFTFPVTVGR